MTFKNSDCHKNKGKHNTVSTNLIVVVLTGGFHDILNFFGRFLKSEISALLNEENTPIK